MDGYFETIISKRVSRSGVRRNDVARRTVTRLRKAEQGRLAEELRERLKHREFRVGGMTCFRCGSQFVELGNDMQCAECAKELAEIYEKCKREALWI